MAKRDEVRVAVSPELKRKLKERYDAVGVSETDYIRCLIIEDLKKCSGK